MRKPCRKCNSSLNSGSKSSIKCIIDNCEEYSHQKCLQDSEVFKCPSHAPHLSEEVRSEEVKSPSGASVSVQSDYSEVLAECQQNQDTLKNLLSRIQHLESKMSKVDDLEHEISQLKEVLSKHDNMLTPKDSMEIHQNKVFAKNVITVKFGNIINEAKDHSIAHCIAKDMCLGDGIALQIKSKLKTVQRA